MGSHPYTSETDAKKQEATGFARRVMEHLEKAMGQGKFKQRVIVAVPAFLGILRAEVNEQLKKIICYELDKNLLQQNPEDIRNNMPNYLPCQEWQGSDWSR